MSGTEARPTVCRLFLCLLLASEVGAQWNLRTHIPAFSTFGAGSHSLIDNKGMVCSNSGCFVYDGDADTWTTIDKAPVVESGSSMATMYFNNFYVVGGLPAQDEVHSMAYIQTAGVWVTKTSMPTARGLTVTSDSDDKLWALGGIETTNALNVVEEYTQSLDAWTTKTSTPTTRNMAAAAYAPGFVVLVGATGYGGITTKYDVNADTWENLNNAPDGPHGMYDNTVGRAGFIYITGGEQTTTPAKTSCHVYDVDEGVWAALDPSPIPNYGQASFLLLDGSYVNVGPSTYAYATGHVQLAPPAYVQGDPMVLTFHGSLHHVHFRPGVFNIFSSKSLLVNVMIDTLPTLPPGDNTVIVAIGVLAVANDTLVQTYCSTVAPSESGACWSSAELLFKPTSDLENAQTNDLVTIRLPTLDVEVNMHTNVIVYSDESGMTTTTPLSRFFDVALCPSSPSFRVGPARGLIPDLGAKSAFEVLYALEDYEVVDGTIFGNNPGSLFCLSHM